MVHLLIGILQRSQSIDPKIQEIIEKINETLVRNFMEYLVFEIGNRSTGTDGCKKAAQYIYQQFETMDLRYKIPKLQFMGKSFVLRFF